MFVPLKEARDGDLLVRIVDFVLGHTSEPSRKNVRLAFTENLSQSGGL